MKRVIELVQNRAFRLVVTDYTVQGGAVTYMVGAGEAWEIKSLYDDAFIICGAAGDYIAIAYSRINRVEWSGAC
jgi:hypothetical protein